VDQTSLRSLKASESEKPIPALAAQRSAMDEAASSASYMWIPSAPIRIRKAAMPGTLKRSPDRARPSM
jgi:hypothetical protein